MLSDIQPMAQLRFHSLCGPSNAQPWLIVLSHVLLTKLHCFALWKIRPEWFAELWSMADNIRMANFPAHCYSQETRNLNCSQLPRDLANSSPLQLGAD